MRREKVEICGIDTSQLKTLTEEKKRELLAKAREGDLSAREELILGNLRLVLSVSGRFNPKHDTGDFYYMNTLDGLHPDEDGMRFIAELLIEMARKH